MDQQLIKRAVFDISRLLNPATSVTCSALNSPDRVAIIAARAFVNSLILFGIRAEDRERLNDFRKASIEIASKLNENFIFEGERFISEADKGFKHLFLVLSGTYPMMNDEAFYKRPFEFDTESLRIYYGLHQSFSRYLFARYGSVMLTDVLSGGKSESVDGTAVGNVPEQV